MVPWWIAGAGVAAAGSALGLYWKRRQPAVAVVRVTGVIRAGRDGGRLVGAGTAASERITGWLRAAQRDDAVRAIVLRVDSPGGSVTASDEIYTEVRHTREQYGKPVVVSMGSVAASGGYYISVPANRIVANPTTLTGSIGVITMIPNYQELLQKIGVQASVLKTGPFKDLTSGLRPLTDQDRAVLQAVLDDSYQRFVEVVAQGRGLAPDRVRELADGRVFTARQAKDLGLVDDLGDLHEAIAAAGRMVGLGDTPRTVEYASGRSFPLRMAAGLTDWLPVELQALLTTERQKIWYLYLG
ncbi:MAG: signal peptide peptidase SppA [Chloroflexi bacterium]|nr:signal peptide peptidase SppA [Chloroflexota bacterium]